VEVDGPARPGDVPNHPDPWLDFTHRDEGYERIVHTVAHLRGTRFHWHFVGADISPGKCEDVGADPDCDELPYYRVHSFPSPDDALAHAGLSRVEDGVSIRVFVEHYDLSPGEVGNRYPILRLTERTGDPTGGAPPAMTRLHYDEWVHFLARIAEARRRQSEEKWNRAERISQAEATLPRVLAIGVAEGWITPGGAAAITRSAWPWGRAPRGAPRLGRPFPSLPPELWGDGLDLDWEELSRVHRV
jgi:hypothetical protein